MRRIILALCLLLACVLGCTQSVLAACSCSLSQTINSTTNAATYDFSSFSPTTSATLIVIAAVRTTVAAGSMVNVSGTSLTWTQEVTGTFASAADTVYLYWANTPASTAASVYRVDVTGDNGAGIGAALWTCTGTDIVTANPIKQRGTNGSTSTNPTSGTITALGTNNCYVALWMGALSSTDPPGVSTAPSGWTEDTEHAFGSPTSNWSAAHRDTGDTSTAITFTASSTTWGLGWAEIYTSGAGPTGWGALVGGKRNHLVGVP